MASFPALVTALALLVYVGSFVMAGRARARYGVRAPAVTGAPEFERAFRIQQNTVEQLVWFVPALWLFVFYVSSLWAGVVGLVWVAARIFYAISYYRDPDSRGPGFVIAFAAAAILLAGGMIGTIVELV
jgi:glutathione S-transferase